jgi:hypothetical protein
LKGCESIFSAFTLEERGRGHERQTGLERAHQRLNRETSTTPHRRWVRNALSFNRKSERVSFSRRLLTALTEDQHTFSDAVTIGDEFWFSLDEPPSKPNSSHSWDSSVRSVVISQAETRSTHQTELNRQQFHLHHPKQMLYSEVSNLTVGQHFIRVSIDWIWD